MPTTREIAQHVGLSHSTVALALRDSRKITTQTRDKVKAAAKEMGWKPNLLVSSYQHSVATGRVKHLEEAVAWLQVSKSPNLWEERLGFRAIRTRAEELGWRVEKFSLRDYGMTNEEDAEHYARKVISVLRARGIRGILIPIRSRLRFSKISNLGEDFVIVSLFNEMYTESVHQQGETNRINGCINPDFFGNTQLAINKLWSLGYKRIGLCLKSWMHWLTNGMIAGGYLTASCSGERFPICLLDDEFIPDHPPENFNRWMSEVRPDAILCGNTEIPGWLEKMGYRVPDDIGVAHFALGPAEAGWTGIDINLDKLAEAGLDLLNYHMLRNQFGQPTVAKNLHIPGFWVEGKTTDRKPQGDFRSYETEWSPSYLEDSQNPNIFK